MPTAPPTNSANPPTLPPPVNPAVPGGVSGPPTTSPSPSPQPPASSASQTVFTRPAPGQVPASTLAPPAVKALPTQVQPGMPLPTPPPIVKPMAPRPVGMPTPASGLPPAAPARLAVPAKPAASPIPPSPTAPKLVGSQPAAPVKPAAVKAEIKKPPFWLFAIIGVVLLGVLGYFLFSAFGGGTPSASKTGTGSTGATGNATKGVQAPATNAKPTTLVYWGLWEPNEVMLDTFKEFEKQYPQYTIDYRKQSFKDYRERLQTAIASGNGPDLFRFHATWTPMLQEELAGAPASVMSVAKFKDTFYPVAAEQLVVNDQIVGLPVEYDSLALYYNKTILQSANAEPPTTWAELKSLADTLTVPANKAERDRAPLQRAGMAIGNSTNVEHFSDILGLLILQNGGDPSAPDSNEVRDALLFYTNFIKEDKVWSEAMPSSTIAFARGDVAMMLAPSWRALDIKAMNPDLDFGVAPVPKLGEKRIGWASYWAEGVNSKSKNQAGAWTFLNFLTSAETEKQFFSAASAVRAFGEPYSRQDLAQELSSDPILANVLADAPTAQSWYLASYTHDNGLNDQLIKYYGDAVTATLSGKGMEEILTTLSAGTTQVLRQYGVNGK